MLTDGFFPPMSAFEMRPATAKAGEPRCRQCGLFAHCTSPKMQLLGAGRRGILIVGPQPSGADDMTGRHLSGKAGKDLRELMAANRIDLDRDCWYTTAAVCHSDATPTTDVVQNCRPLLLSRIEKLKPKVIILLGSVAVKAVVGHLWKDDISLIDPWVGWQIPAREWNCWVCPLWGPGDFYKDAERQVQMRLQRAYMADAVAASTQPAPWPDGPPDYAKQVELIYDPTQAAAIIDRMVERGGPVAFDYETNALKPERSDSKIVCVSLSWRGRKTICCPWAGPVIPAMKRFLASEANPKIASNAAFEHRWGIAKLGIETANWAWDTMQAAHVQNVVKLVTSIKFQSFVHLGQPDYDSHIKPYLESAGASKYELNRIHEVAVADLYLYCGMDSILEYIVAEKQQALIGGQRRWF